MCVLFSLWFGHSTCAPHLIICVVTKELIAMQTCVNMKNWIDPFSESSFRDKNVKNWTESIRRNARNRTVSNLIECQCKSGTTRNLFNLWSVILEWYHVENFGYMKTTFNVVGINVACWRSPPSTYVVYVVNRVTSVWSLFNIKMYHSSIKN